MSTLERNLCFFFFKLFKTFFFNETDKTAPISVDSAEDFIINKNKPTKPSKARKRRGRGHKRTVPKKQRLLQQAANAKGQRTVRDFFLTEDEESDLVRQFFFIDEGGDENIRGQSPIVIDSSSSDCVPIVIMQTGGFDGSGPVNVSSPLSDTQVFDDHPSQSPIY